MTDGYDSVWLNCYDEIAEHLLEISADEFAGMNKDEVTEHIRKVRYKEVKLKLVSKNDEYKGEVRRKTTAIKILDLDYAEESKKAIARIQKKLGIRA